LASREGGWLAMLLPLRVMVMGPSQCQVERDDLLVVVVVVVAVVV